MSWPHLSAGNLAKFDQLWARVSHNLNGVLAAYEDVSADKRNEGWESAVAGCARWLYDHAEHQACAEMLACAIHRLSTQATKQGGKASE